MHYVYILRSQPSPLKLYIGLTQDVERRVQQHNRGDTPYTRTDAPWELEAYVAFKNRQVAEDFERYLKAGSQLVVDSVVSSIVV